MHFASDQYHTITTGAGWADRRDRGRLRFEGKDAASFLHALVTNDVHPLFHGQSVYTALLTPQGRMITDLTLHNAGDSLLADVPPGLSESLATRFDQLIFAEDVRVSDVSSTTFQITLLGTAADVLVADLTKPDLVIAPGSDLGVPTFDVFGASDLFDECLQQIDRRDAVQVSPDLLDALRIDAGRPAFGVDMTTETIPLEAGLLDRAISTTKGCYVGQEVIIRILHRGGGRIAKRLVKIGFDESTASPPSADSTIDVDGKTVGRVTSAAVSPVTGRVIALGYVQRELAEAGQIVLVGSDTPKRRGEVLALAG